MTFSRPLMYVPRMTGCFRGRGEMEISIAGFALANAGSVFLRKELVDTDLVRDIPFLIEEGD
jgi:hypothetical protein